MSRTLAWRRLIFDGPLAPGTARACLVGLATLSGQPRVVLEAVSQGHEITWRVGSDESAMPKVKAVFAAHSPNVRLVPAGSTFEDITVIEGASLGAANSRTVALRSDPDAIDQVTRQLFAVLTSTGKSETVRLQLILGPRTHPRRAPEVEPLERRKIQVKHSEYGFGCALRIAARSGHAARCHQLISNVAASFKVLDMPGLHLSLRRQGTRAIHDIRSPFFWPLWLSVDDLVPLMAWPVLTSDEEQLPGLPPRHPRLLPTLTIHTKAGEDGRPFGAAASVTKQGRPRLIRQPVTDGLRHTHVLGLNGTGKSTLLGHLALDDLQKGRGAVLIDPKGDLVDDILARAPRQRLSDIVVLDPRADRPIGINPLVGRDPELAADSVLAVFHDLFADSWGPRTSDILHASLLTLARRGDASLVMLPLLLTNPGFRKSIVREQATRDPLGLGTFWATFEAWSDAERAQAIQPLMNKLRTVLLRPSLRAIFGQRTPSFDLTDVFTKNRVLLVALGKGTIGPEGAKLLGSLVTTQLWHAVLSRIQVPQAERTPLNVYIDEVQDYIAGIGDLGDALATARGYGVGFTIAHQELGQLGTHKAAVLANARSRLVFQTAPQDAAELGRHFGAGLLDRDDFRALGAYQAYGQILVDNSLSPWVSIHSQPWTKAKRDPATVRAASSSRYGRALDDIEADLMRLIQHPGQPQEQGTPDAAKPPPNAPRGDRDPSEPGPPEPRPDAPTTTPQDEFGRRRPKRPTPPEAPESSARNTKGGTP